MRIGYTHDFKNSYGRPWKQVWEDALFLMCEAARLGFDYVLVQGLARDPFEPGARLAGARVHLVAEGGIWRLYAVDR